MAGCLIQLRISSFSSCSLYIPNWSNFIGPHILCIFSFLPDPKGIIADTTSRQEHHKHCNNVRYRLLYQCSRTETLRKRMKRIKLADEVMFSIFPFLVIYLNSKSGSLKIVFKGIVIFLDITVNKFLQTADNIYTS